MIAHDELVAGEGIEGILELLGLRHREIACVDHSIELTLQERLACRFGQKGKGLGEHERKRCREERIEHADSRWSRVFLDPEHRAHTSRVGSRYSSASVPKESREVASTS